MNYLSKTPQDIISAASHHELEVPPSDFFQKVLRMYLYHTLHSAPRWLQPFSKPVAHGSFACACDIQTPKNLTLLTFTLRATTKYLFLPVIGRSPRLWRLALKKNWLDLGPRTRQRITL
ncbi:uncharacterized protein B0T23DRAFT_374042 [Neurospora hispaniola]|uniref:Uncharacterized protein n=1 Tax=Neurospora hispaniola TaxID=588809 RepID=A0AAJ0MTS7_9PEZI|nr:hypothetical protein B0T23DRAFT_374042 [Neurospora hispaniola]